MTSNSSFHKNKISTAFLRLGIVILAKLNQIFRKIPYRNSQKVVIISLHKIGDTIFSFPTLRFFHEKYGNNLTVICLKSTESLYNLLDIKFDIVSLDEQNFYLDSRLAGFKSRKIMRILRPRTIIDITGEINSVSFFAFCRAKNIYGRCSNYLQPFYDKNILKEEKPTLSERIFDVAKLIESEVNINYYRSKDPINYPVKNICIHPFAGWKAKEWNFHKFIKIAEHLSNNYNCKFVSEPNFIPNDLINYLKDTNIELILTHSLEDLITQIKYCDLFIGNDSGPANIASFLGKKTFVIYGPVNPLYCFEDANNARFIAKHLKCSPKGWEHYCFTNAGREGCPSFECMNQLSLEEVLKSVILLITK